MHPNEPNEDDLIPLSPLDEDDERRRRQAREEDLHANRELLEAMTRRPNVPLEHRENLTMVDLEHFVINYCLDSHDGHLERAFQNVQQLRRFAALGRRTVEEFIDGKEDPALKDIPAEQLANFYQSLLDEIREG